MSNKDAREFKKKSKKSGGWTKDVDRAYKARKKKR
jgi:hypothetical protein